MTDVDIAVATEPVGPIEDPAADEAADEAPPVPDSRSRRRTVLLVLLALLVPALLVGAIAGGLLAWDGGYAARVLPGVHVGEADLSGLDRTAASAAIGAAYPYQDGRVVLRTPDGEITIPYADFGRRPDIDALVDEAMASGRAGGLLDRTVAQIRQAMDGAVIEPRAVFDEAALTAAVTAALRPLERDPVDASIAMGSEGPVTTPAREGRSVDPGPVATAAVAGVTGADAPPEVVLDVETVPIAPAIDDEAVAIAQVRAQRMIDDVRVKFGKKTWTIKAETVRDWIRFEEQTHGSVSPVADASAASSMLGAATNAVARKPVDAIFLKNRRGKAIGVVASREGRALDVDATVARIAAEIEARGTGNPSADVAVAVAKVLPKLTTEEARKVAPLMVKLGSWTTWFPISERNYFGANIWRPAQMINGTVLGPGETFDWWRAIWPVTPARGFGPGGVIRADHTDPTGALGGGMCSSSTTLFNAALRAGLQMGARSNHKYYINRYPLGLDATVSIMGGGRQTMSFTNDTGHSIVIRAFKIRGSGGRGKVRYEIWGAPDGRRVEISRPSVSNVLKATTNVVPVTTLRHGVREQVEYPSNGMDVLVTRVVRNAKGRVIHRDAYRTHYVLWNGRIEVGV
jgi:vancomycin resistance protein YoaR